VPRHPRLGDILIQAGLIDELQLQTALAEQQQWGNRLGSTLVRLGVIDERELVRALSRKLGVPAVRIDGKEIDPAVLALVPRELAERHACLPLFTKREAGVEVIYVGMEDPGDLAAIDDLSFRTGMKVRPVIVAPSELWETLEQSYAAREPATAPAATGAAPPAEDTQPELVAVERPAARPPARDALLPASGPAAGAAAGVAAGSPTVGSGAAAAPGEAGERARVPTRAILQALTQLLLEKEIIGREELLRRIESVRGRGE
jgi:type IV pilus assembly protein PilB